MIYRLLQKMRVTSTGLISLDKLKKKVFSSNVINKNFVTNINNIIQRMILATRVTHNTLRALNYSL